MISLLLLLNSDGNLEPFFRVPLITPHFYRWAIWWTPLNRNSVPESHIGKDGFRVSMDVSQFEPNELTVKVVDNKIVIEGTHEETRDDDPCATGRNFVRRYALPKGYDSEKVVSTLSPEGILVVSVPKTTSGSKSNERVVEIQLTAPAREDVKQNPKEEDKQEKTKRKKVY